MGPEAYFSLRAGFLRQGFLRVLLLVQQAKWWPPYLSDWKGRAGLGSEVLLPSSGLETNQHEARSEDCGRFLEDGSSVLLLNAGEVPVDCIGVVATLGAKPQKPVWPLATLDTARLTFNWTELCTCARELRS
jgi:hypothetical protein